MYVSVCVYDTGRDTCFFSRSMELVKKSGKMKDFFIKKQATGKVLPKSVFSQLLHFGFFVFRQTVPDQRKNMWIIMFLMSYSVLPDDVGGQELLVAAPAFVVNLTLESEDGSYVDSRQVLLFLVVSKKKGY
jgi:hypothetical protein